MDDRLRRLYELVGEMISQPPPAAEQAERGYYDAPLPPIEIGATLSATDLLSWWFRPPSNRADAWDTYLGDSTVSLRPLDSADRDPTAPYRPPLSTAGSASRAAIEALLPDPSNELASEDADAAAEVLYEFLHAFGCGDLEAALQFVSEDYHVMDDDRDINKDELRGQLERMTASLHGFSYDVSVAAVPRVVLHPYGALIYAEIVIDAINLVTAAKRCLVERRLVVLEQLEAGWRIAALSKPRV